MKRHEGTLKDRPRKLRDETSIHHELVLREENLRRSSSALAALLQHIGEGTEASPQVARSIQATENRWRAIEDEFGLLDSAGVARVLGTSPTNRNLAHAKAKEGKILGVKRGKKNVYPGFQFDREHGEIRPVIAEVTAIGRRSGWQDRHLLLWFCAPNGYLDGLRPVDVIDNHDKLVAAAESDLAERW